MHFNDFDDDIIDLALWVWDRVPGFSDAARLIQALFKLAKAVVGRRESLPPTQTISLPTIASTAVLFAPTIRAESYVTAQLTSGGTPC